MTDLPITGGCLCGAVRYSITAEPMLARHCWCRLCQYLGAGGGTVNVGFPSDQFTLTGTLTIHEAIADSRNLMRRGFCPACGTPVTSAAVARPHLIFVRTGTLDDPNLMPPQISIWTAEAPDWACIDPAIPNIAGQPPPPVDTSRQA